MIKKIGALVLALSLTVGILLSNMQNKVVLADSSRFGGYYESCNDTCVLDVGEAVSVASSAVITGVNKVGGELNEKVAISVNGNMVTIKPLPQNISESMVLGNYYTLTLNGTKSVEFRFVTKAIRNKEDVQVLNITSNDIPVTGYYVLTNNLILEKGEEPFHDANGEESGNGLSYKTLGFTGTFDGQGYNIEFWSNYAGFFGCIGERAVIKNTGFVNVKLDLPGEYPVLAGATSTGISGETRSTVESIYVCVAFGNIPEGGLFSRGSIPIILKNIVLEFPGVSIANGTGGSGALWGADYGWWNYSGSTPQPNTYPCDHDDVYVIGRIPLMHYKHISAENKEGKKGFFITSNGTLSRGWMEGFAENEGVEEDIYNGNKVYTGIRKYNTLALLADDETNDYSSFDTRYWGVEKFGIPVWLNGVENSYDIYLETFGQKTSAAFYLERGGVSNATIGFGLGSIPVQDVQLNFEFLNGQEFISIDSATGVVSAVADGMAQFKVRCSYNGKDFEKKYTVYVTTKEGYNPKDDDSSAGCGTFIVDGGMLGGGALMILSALAFTLLKRRKSLV